MLEQPHKTKIDLPEELLCAYVEGKATPEEERRLLQMMASDPLLAQFVQDMEETMGIIDMVFDDELDDSVCYSISADASLCACEEPYYARERRVESLRPQSRMSKSMSTHRRVTPKMVGRLGANEIFVFGSNPWGMHNGGASKLAKVRFGAIQGHAEGLQGQSYAIPTIVGSVDNIAIHVNRFLAFAQEHPELHFLVTRIGCGTAGYDPADIAPLFVKAKDMENISLPQDFWDVIRSITRL